MTNPDPARITNEMWRLWTDRPTKDWLLSGIYADKEGYHNTVIANENKWPGNYSITVPLDLVSYNRDKARAIDLTMSDSEMVKWTTRMRDSAVDPNDNRLAAVKEFYGTLDNKTVFGLKKTNKTGPWTHSSADSTHLWHGHTSIFTTFVKDWLNLMPILSVWAGDSLEGWDSQMTLPIKNDHGEDVRYWQLIHNAISHNYNPPLSVVTADGDYGDATQAAIVSFWKAVGGTGKYDGSYLHAWTALKYMDAYIALKTPVVSMPETTNTEQLRALVNEWLTKNLPSKLNLAGDFSGKVSLL